MFETKTLTAPHKGTLVEITDSVKELVNASGVQSGIVVVCTPHADAGILCTSFYDSKGHEDIIDDFTRIWPARDNFHCEENVTKCAAHTKAAVAGQSMDFIVENGEMQLGGSQGIFFAEYCEPQPREYTVKVFGV